MPKFPVCKAFVKPNEVLAEVKPRLIQRFGPQGSAQSALMNQTIESDRFRLAYFLARSIKSLQAPLGALRFHQRYHGKSTGTFGVNERIRSF